MSRQPTLVWAPKGLDPLSSVFEPEPASKAGLSLNIYGNIDDAVDAALEQRSTRSADGLLPYICVGTGEGAAVFNIQGILALKMAYMEGADDARRT